MCSPVVIRCRVGVFLFSLLRLFFDDVVASPAFVLLVLPAQGEAEA